MSTKRKCRVLILLAGIILLLSIFAPFITPYDPDKQDLTRALLSPSREHIFGTDRYGRDMLSRVIAGARTSVSSVLLLVAAISFIGTVAGVICGYIGGKIDTILMRISDIFLAFPGMVLAIAVAGVLGGGILNAVIAVAVISWPKYARLSRSQVLSEKSAVYMEAAKLSGCNSFQIIVKHMLPNMIGTILVTAVLDIGTMMMEIAGLSFLGLGAMPPTAEWGSMMSNGRSMIQTAPWVILAPGGAIFITVAVFNLLGDTLRDRLDSRQNKTRET
jgi:peptide/nickel transport system permease protein